MSKEIIRIKYKGKEDMIPWDYNGKRYTFSKAKPIKEYPAEAINWLFQQKDRGWHEILEILPLDMLTVDELPKHDQGLSDIKEGHDHTMLKPDEPKPKTKPASGKKKKFKRKPSKK